MVSRAKLDRLHRRSIVLRAERDDESFICQESGILLKHGSRVPRRYELDGPDSATAERVGCLLQVSLEVRELALGIVGKEWIRRDAAGCGNYLLDSLHRKERLRVFRHESRTSCLQQLAPNLILDRSHIAQRSFQRIAAEYSFIYS